MIGIYAGSFDPPTNGHLWMIEQGAKLFCKFYVAIGQNSQKAYTFSLDERVEMLQELCADFSNVEVVQFENKFLVKYAESIGVDYILRGIRNEKDYTYERGMRYVNSNMNNTIQTLFMMSPRFLVEVSSRSELAAEELAEQVRRSWLGLRTHGINWSTDDGNLAPNTSPDPDHVRFQFTGGLQIIL